MDKEEDELYGDKEGKNEIKVPITREERKKLIREVLKDNESAKQDNKRKPLKKSNCKHFKTSSGKSGKSPEEVRKSRNRSKKQWTKIG
ncbi:MAG: hypothetical protein BME94_05545 [Methanobacteriales archaeon Met13]